MADDFVKVATTDEIEEGKGKQIEIGDKSVAVFKVDGAFCSIDGICTHAGGPLGDGFLDGDEVTCPWHGATFNVKTWEVTGPPAMADVPCYEVRVDGSDIEIKT